MTPRSRAWAAAVACSILSAPAVSCQAGDRAVRSAPPPPTVVTSTTSAAASDPQLATAVLTVDGDPPYVFSTGGAWADVTAPATYEGGNSRYVFWPSGTESGHDEVTCATWTKRTGTTSQVGAALRVAVEESVPRAITITHNVLPPIPWEFNVHEWIGEQYTLIGHFDLRRALRITPLPWRMCARAAGTTVEFKVWPATQAEPAWGDPSHGGAVEVAADWVYPGQPGWYVGHLHAGDGARFDEMTTAALPRTMGS